MMMKLRDDDDDDDDNDDDDDDDLGPPVNQPGVGEQLVAQAGHSASTAVAPLKYTSTYVGWSC